VSKQHRLLWISPIIFFFSIIAPAAAQTPAPAQAPPVPRLDIYGFVMTDFGYDLRTNDPNWFDVNRPTKLPSFDREFGRDGKTFAGVRQTRFGVKGYEATSWGELRTQFEFDMFGVGPDAGQTTIRPRHFYGELGAFGAGQTNSPFMDIDIFPNILDYWGPNGMVFFRNVQVRWMPIRGETRLTIALERPGASQDIGLLASRPQDRIEFQNVQPRFPWPDLSGEYRYSWKPGSYVKGSGIVRSVKLDDQVRDAFNFDDSLVGWGVDLSSNLKFGKDVLRLQYVFGDGIQNYMNDAPVDVASEPNFGDPRRPVKGKALPMRSLVAFLDHSWTDKWTTSAGYSELVIDNTALQLPKDFHRGQYAIANLLYTPFEHVMYGGELQWGRRTNFGDGFHSNDYRIQFSFKYNFAAQIGGVK
jgi:outer membrane DcaP-like protein